MMTGPRNCRHKAVGLADHYFSLWCSCLSMNVVVQEEHGSETQSRSHAQVNGAASADAEEIAPDE